MQGKIIQAIKKNCEIHGGQVAYSKSSGVSQGQISDYICGRRKIDNMPLGTLQKLFPEIEINFFNDEEDVDYVEREIGNLIKILPPHEKVLCLKILAAHFSEYILEKENKVNSD